MGAKGSKLDHDTIAASTQFDKREIHSWHRSFLKEVPSGRITEAEFCALYAHFFPFGDARPFARLVFRLFTVNGEDSIEFGEYLMALSTASRGRLEDKLKWTFKFYDVDGDGRISRNDARTVLEAAYAMMIGMVEVEDGVEGRLERTFRDRAALEYEQFKAAVQEDPGILQGLLIYDGLV